jgi:hypothetical protein
METTATTQSVSTTALNTDIWTSTSVPTTFSTRTATSYRRTATTTSTPSACSIYSESWYSAATSYYGADTRPTICGGSGQYPKYTSYPTSTTYDKLDAQIDAANRYLDKRIEAKIIILAVVGGLMLVLVIASVVLTIRRRRKQREQLGLIVAKNFQQQYEHGMQPAAVPEVSKDTHNREQGVVGASNGMATTAPSK